MRNRLAHALNGNTASLVDDGPDLRINVLVFVLLCSYIRSVRFDKAFLESLCTGDSPLQRRSLKINLERQGPTRISPSSTRMNLFFGGSGVEPSLQFSGRIRSIAVRRAACSMTSSWAWARRQFGWRQMQSCLSQYFYVERSFADSVQVQLQALTEARIYVYPEASALEADPGRQEDESGQGTHPQMNPDHPMPVSSPEIYKAGL